MLSWGRDAHAYAAAAYCWCRTNAKPPGLARNRRPGVVPVFPGPRDQGTARTATSGALAGRRAGPVRLRCTAPAALISRPIRPRFPARLRRASLLSVAVSHYFPLATLREALQGIVQGARTAEPFSAQAGRACPPCAASSPRPRSLRGSCPRLTCRRGPSAPSAASASAASCLGSGRAESRHQSTARLRRDLCTARLWRDSA